ncbi:MAG: sulfatase-like hydrolase/transferase [Coriobacteriales bacterium]|nr:sulfatase-like hydrolase/transferase [Coriobacteriales bacterium]
MEDTERNLSRRDFVGLAGGAAAAVAAQTPLAACLADEAAADSAEATSASERAGIAAPVSPHTNADGNYNIILIVTDQEHYYDHYPEGTNFRARELLTELGTTFEKHYACSNMSTSSRAVLYTGTHVTENLMRDNVEFPWQLPLDEKPPTIGDRMRDAGYYTAYKGKFHMGSAGAFDVPDDDTVLQVNGMEPYGFSDWNAIGEIAGAPLQGYHYDDYIEGEATQWLREKGSAVNADGQSFFLAVNFVNPHDIMYFDATDEGDTSQKDSARLTVTRTPGNTVYQKAYPDLGLPAGLRDTLDNEGRIPAHAEYERAWEKNAGSFEGTDEQWARFRDFYLNCIQDNDDYVLELLHEIANLGLFENTIIMMTSDHGEMEGDHGLRGKGNSVYERNIHVPFLVYHPAIPGGNRISRVTSHVDVAPTILGLTNLSADEQATIGEGLRGTSFAGELFEPSDNEGEALFAFEMLSMVDGDMVAERDACGKVVNCSVDLSKRGFMRALITPHYKFARYFAISDRNLPTTVDELYAHNDVELYDLDADPDELHNLGADRETYKPLIEALNNQLNDLIAQQIGEDTGLSWEKAQVFWDDMGGNLEELYAKLNGVYVAKSGDEGGLTWDKMKALWEEKGGVF